MIKEIGEKFENENLITCETVETGEDIVDLKELNPTDKKLITFHGVVLETQKKCNDNYTRERHSNVFKFYLSQNYFRLPRQTIWEIATSYVFLN